MKINILGLGESLRFYKRNPKEIAIGVNEVGSITACDYVCIINNRNEFHAPRYRKILQPIGQPKLITHSQSIENALGGFYKKTEVIEIHNIINKHGKVVPCADIRGSKFFHSQSSPFVAAVYAVRELNPSVLSLWGVDFVTHKAISKRDVHRLNRELLAWDWLIKECIRLDIEVEAPEYSVLSKIIEKYT